MDTLVGILMYLMGTWRAWCRSEELWRENVIRVVWMRNYVKYMA